MISTDGPFDCWCPTDPTPPPLRSMATLPRTRDNHSNRHKTAPHSDAHMQTHAADTMRAQAVEETNGQDASMAAVPAAVRVLPGSHQYLGGTAGCRRSALWQRSLHMDARRTFDQSSWIVRRLAEDPQGVHSLASITSDAFVPCFALHYHPSPLSNTLTAASSSKHGSLLVAGDENGWMHFLHANGPNYEQQWATRTKFRAHDNAIFDFQWCDPAMQQHSGEITGVDRTGPVADLLITASGDQTLKVWDVTQLECLYTLRGHKGSIKTVRMQPGNQSQFRVKRKAKRMRSTSGAHLCLFAVCVVVRVQTSLRVAVAMVRSACGMCASVPRDPPIRIWSMCPTASRMRRIPSRGRPSARSSRRRSKLQRRFRSCRTTFRA